MGLEGRNRDERDIKQNWKNIPTTVGLILANKIGGKFRYNREPILFVKQYK